MKKPYKLLYIYDPMCSWCWGFKPVLEEIIKQISDSLEIEFILGGLAADTDDIMPEDMKQQIISNWHRIEESIPGTKFNFQFWNKCTARRSTYPACRAVLAAKAQNPNKEFLMLNAIQEAYYKQARNPSNYEVLYGLAKSLKLDMDKFKTDIHSEKIENQLMEQIKFSRSIGADSFPSLYIEKDQHHYPVALDYNNADIIIDHINSIIQP